MCAKTQCTGANTSSLFTFGFGEISTCAWVHHLTAVWRLRCFENFFTRTKAFVCVTSLGQARNGIVIQRKTFALHNRRFCRNNTNGSKVIELLVRVGHIGIMHVEVFKTNKKGAATCLNRCIRNDCSAEIAEVQHARRRRSKPPNHYWSGPVASVSTIHASGLLGSGSFKSENTSFPNRTFTSS